ncbi:MAG: protein-L-isoaspartate O-methyltransferase [Alphaproteobacteria bacterium]|nr:protein-L-isoaspartate O-methyltransferase [Alphaproteobacteria bacterium]
MSDFSHARRNMVLSQLAPSEVSDHRVLAAMGSVPREVFVPGALAAIAYVDEDIKVAEGRYLMEPVVLARLLQEARPMSSDLALDLACATGYTTAVLGRLVGTVVAVERDAGLVRRASELLARLGVDNAAVVSGDVVRGRPDQGPYNVILINGRVPKVPSALFDQLAEGGRLVTVVGEERSSAAMCFRKSGGSITPRRLFDASVPTLPEFLQPVGFVF